MSKSKNTTYRIVEYVFDNMRSFLAPNEVEVENQKELLSLPWVKAHQKDKRFARFSISEKEDVKYLMVEDADCNWWWVVASLPLDFPCTFPKFKSIKDKTILENDPTEEVQEVPKSDSRKKK